MNHIKIIWFTLAVLISYNLYSQESFFAPSERTGRITVKLYPTEVVMPENPVRVTFGIPFTRGSVTAEELKTIRVMKEGSEIPCFVASLTPWRNPVTGDTSFVRVALIQLEYSFICLYPDYESISIEWGISQHTKKRIAYVHHKTAWHKVEEGSFASADNVYEPDVYAVLPKDLMCKGVLKTTRMKPFSDAIAETRDSTNKPDYDVMPEGMVHETAAKNFLFTLINEDDFSAARDLSRKCNYKEDYEPWLFDRSAAMYIAYFRSGFIKPLREAVRASQFYKQKIYSDTVDCLKCTGFFSLKMDKNYKWPGGNNSMYSYNENLAYTYWLTGDTDVLEYLPWIVQAQSYSEETRWSPENKVFTERHIAFQMLANMVAYEVLGKSEYYNTAMKIQDDLIWHQNGAGGQIPADRLNGALWHYGTQHGDAQGYLLGASPWMSAILIDAALRNYAVTGREEIALFIYRFGEFFMESSILTKSAFGGGRRSPVYFYYIDGSYGKGTNENTDPLHAVDVGVSLAWASFFSKVSGQNNESMQNAAKEFFDTYKVVVKNSTVSGSSDTAKIHYRVSPWRKYNWEHRISGSFPWLLFQN